MSGKCCFGSKRSSTTEMWSAEDYNRRCLCVKTTKYYWQKRRPWHVLHAIPALLLLGCFTVAMTMKLSLALRWVLALSGTVAISGLLGQTCYCCLVLYHGPAPPPRSDAWMYLHCIAVRASRNKQEDSLA